MKNIEGVTTKRKRRELKGKKGKWIASKSDEKKKDGSRKAGSQRRGGGASARQKLDCGWRQTWTKTGKERSEESSNAGKTGRKKQEGIEHTRKRRETCAGVGRGIRIGEKAQTSDAMHGKRILIASSDSLSFDGEKASWTLRKRRGGGKLRRIEAFVSSCGCKAMMTIFRLSKKQAKKTDTGTRLKRQIQTRDSNGVKEEGAQIEVKRPGSMKGRLHYSKIYGGKAKKKDTGKGKDPP